jgi:hypothetical protein
LDRGWIARLESIAVPPAITLVAFSLFVAARLADLDGDASRFVVAGRTFVDPAEAPPGLHVFPHGGYDGQFFYRLAVDPAELGAEAYGIRLDIGLRRARIGYPALAWAASAGQARAVLWALIALNVASAVVLAFLGALAARESGRQPLWGLLVVGFPGFMFTVARDLSEVLAATLLLGGLLAYRRRRPEAAGVLLALAVLTRESTALAVAALAVVWLLQSRNVRVALAWALPAAAFVAWEMLVYVDVGALPISAGRGNIGAPFAGLVVCLSDAIYLDPADFRALGELWVLSLLVLLGDSRRGLGAPALLTAAVWGAEALYRAFVL